MPQDHHHLEGRDVLASERLKTGGKVERAQIARDDDRDSLRWRGGTPVSRTWDHGFATR
jgi:hypothetical protein